jgi:preprotein translocase subunit SecB
VAKKTSGARGAVASGLKNMDFTIPLKNREVEQAAALQARLQLQDISLYKSEAAGAGPPIGAVEPVTLSAELDSEMDRRDSAGVDFAVTLRVACHEALTFHIDATFLARYRFADQTKTASKIEIEAFRKSHAVLAVWPYLREFVQSTAARMGFPTEPLPLLSVVPRKE